jgi:hypothetical protein
MLDRDALSDAFELIVKQLQEVDEPERPLFQAKLLLLCVRNLPNAERLEAILSDLSGLASESRPSHATTGK